MLLLSPVVVCAQQVLTLQNAIDTALRNNFDIRIARNNADAKRMQNTFGYAGGLPTIGIDAGDRAALSDISQVQNNGSSTSASGVLDNSLDAGISAGMLLFNGFRVFATKERLSLLQQQSELQLNQQIQNTLAAIMVKYYDIIRQESYLNIMQSSFEVSSKKFEIIQERDKVGMASAADILQARMDMNAASQSLTLQQVVVEQAKADLCLLMGSKQFTSFVIRDSIVTDPLLMVDSINSYLTRNPEYLSAGQQVSINEQIVKELSARRYPTVKINTGYDYSYSKYHAGLSGMNRISGPSAGITLQIPIYNGNIYRIEKKSAELDVASAQIEQDRLLSKLRSDALKTYLSYTSTLKQVATQESNFELAKKLVEVVLLNFQMNQATILDVKTAQATFEEAAYLLVNLKYAAKTAEIELKLMTYQLGN